MSADEPNDSVTPTPTPAPAPAPSFVDTWRNVPPLTWVVIAVCVAIWAVLNFAPNRLSVETVAPRAGHIWHGAVWGLVTSAFVHVQFWHIAFNVFWTRDLGRLIEPKIGVLRFAAFVLAAGFVSSGWELLVMGATGIGFSGVVYALFGLAVARRKYDPDYAAFVTVRTFRWMIGWLVLCIVLTVAKVWLVANAAHVSGLAFGWLVGMSSAGQPRRMLARAVAVACVAGAVMSVVYMPWSEQWKSREALAYLENATVRANAGDPQARAEVGAWYARFPDYREDPGEPAHQRVWACSASPPKRATLRVHATCPDPKFRSGDEAIRWATMAADREPTVSNLDILAAAYAEAKRWEEAVTIEKRAMAGLPVDETDLRKILDAHLHLFEKSEPVRAD